MPNKILGVSISSNIITPKNTAVTGSNAPKTAVGVEPMYLMALVVQTKDITVVNTASDSKLPHKYHLSTMYKLVPNLTVQKKTDTRKEVRKTLV